MNHLQESLARARKNPDEEHQLTIPLRNLISQATHGNTTLEAVENHLGDPSETPLFNAVYHHAYWKLSDTDPYSKGAQPALQQYQDALQTAQDNDWPDVAAFCITQLITLYGELNHDDDLQQWIEEAISFLESEYDAPDAHLGNIGRLLDAIQSHQYAATEPTLRDVVTYLHGRVKYAQQRNDYRNERDFLEDCIELKQYLGEDIGTEQATIADSFEAEAKKKGQRSSMIRASVLSSAVDRCAEFVDEQRVAKWKRAVRDANRTAIEDEMSEVTHKPSDEEIEELEEAVESMVETYEQWVTEYDPASAFKLTLTQDAFIPDMEMSREIAQGSMISEIVTRSTISPEGDTVAIRNPRDDLDQRPANYSALAQHTEAILGSLLFRLTSRNILQEHHFYRLIEDAHWLSTDDKAFLTDLIVDFFSHRYAEALHIGVARLEGVISRTLEYNGVPVTSFQAGESEQRTLGGLLREMNGTVDENLVSYLNYRYVDPAGMNLRNRVSHGQFRYRNADFHQTSISLFDIFRSISKIETAYD